MSYDDGRSVTYPQVGRRWRSEPYRTDRSNCNQSGQVEIRMDRTLVIIKPDAVQRRLIGRILGRFEDKGLKIAAMKLVRVTDELAREMYGEHEGKDFYEPVSIVRKLIGPTFGPDAPAGTIRGDFGSSRRYNLIHGSDSAKSADREIGIFFGPEELADYELVISDWTYAKHLGQFI